LTGTAVFFSLPLLTGANLPSSGGAGLPIGLLAAIPLTAVLTLPPLYLISSLRGRVLPLRMLAAVGLAGPMIAGSALGASAPLLGLYAMTGELAVGFFLLLIALVGLAVVLGGIGARRNAARAGDADPGPILGTAHYLLTLWTAAVLALQLS